MKKHRTILTCLVLTAMLLSSCGQSTRSHAEVLKEEIAKVYDQSADVTLDIVQLEDEAVALADAPAAVPAAMTPTASGTQQKKGGNAIVDYSNTADGYVMVKYNAKSSKRLKAQVKGPKTTYTYNITAEKWEVFPLSDGSGNYQVGVFENVSGNSYSNCATVSFSAKLKDEFVPFLYPNQYVDYSVAPKSVAKAAELTKGISDNLKKVQAIYDYVVKNLTYDKELAKTVQSGYLPTLDKTLEKKSGICFDYASLMTGMLRSQGVPCKLVIGYAGTAYHAWISVWTKESGWVDSAIFFDGTTWHRMDPTFASSSKQSKSIMEYIGDGSNYSAKYLY